MRRAAYAGAAYFAVVFAAGFALGALRVLAVAPQVGETAAVLAEIPVLLAIAWIVCGRIVARFEVDASYEARGTMGLFAFTLLLFVEFSLAALVFGRPLEAQLAAYAEPAGALGLAAQFVFGMLPLFRR